MGLTASSVPPATDAVPRQPDVVPSSREEAPEAAPLPTPLANQGPSSSKGFAGAPAPSGALLDSAMGLSSPTCPSGSGTRSIRFIINARPSAFPEGLGMITELDKEGPVDPASSAIPLLAERRLTA